MCLAFMVAIVIKALDSSKCTLTPSIAIVSCHIILDVAFRFILTPSASQLVGEQDCLSPSIVSS